MNGQDPQHGIIGLGVALTLFALLIVAALLTLKGMALAIALIIVLALAAKTFVHHLRRRLD